MLFINVVHAVYSSLAKINSFFFGFRQHTELEKMLFTRHHCKESFAFIWKKSLDNSLKMEGETPKGTFKQQG